MEDLIYMTFHEYARLSKKLGHAHEHILLARLESYIFTLLGSCVLDFKEVCTITKCFF